MDVREVRMVGFRRCVPRLAKSKAIKAHCRSQPQVVCRLPVRVFRLQLGGSCHHLLLLRDQIRTDECVFLWSGMATTCALLTVGHPLILRLSRCCPYLLCFPL
jgi:hypothetical protein